MTDIVESTVIMKALDEETMIEEAKNERRSNSFHASSILDCGRKQVYELLAYDKEPVERKPSWAQDAEAGNIIHRNVQRLLKQHGMIEKDEFTLPPNEYQIGGRIDGIISVNGELCILEIKTMKEEYFKTAPNNEKFDSYYAQSQLYLHFTGFNKAYLLMINRNNHAKKEYLLPKNDVYLDKLLRRMKRLKDYKDNRIIPDPEPTFLQCKYCHFRNRCQLDSQLQRVTR